jgi:hypothetical protein
MEQSHGIMGTATLLSNRVGLAVKHFERGLSAV